MKVDSIKSISLISLISILSISATNVYAKYSHCESFSELSIVLEQNATDSDSEVVMFAKGQDIGMDKFIVRAPDNRKVAKFNGDKRGVGLREFLLESAEPPELDKVLASFPEGEYSFNGRTVEGGCLTGTAYLSHSLAPETQILSPEPNEVVNRNFVVISWMPMDEAVGYVVELKNEETEKAILVEIPATATSFDAPASWLVPDTEYQVAVTVLTESGNKTSVESAFFTEFE